MAINNSGLLELDPDVEVLPLRRLFPCDGCIASGNWEKCSQFGVCLRPQMVGEYVAN